MLKKVANLNEGYGVCVMGESKKWWQNGEFPLVPILWYRKANEHDSCDFGFSWLFFVGWTLMSPDIGFEVFLDDIGFKASIRVPYFKFIFKVNLFPRSWYQKSWRTGRRKR